MKKLGELGISPAPWDAAKSDCGVWSVFDRNGQSCQFREADARLMAAAPELYVALREVVETLYGLGFQPIVKGDPLAVAVVAAESALEKAGGAE